MSETNIHSGRDSWNSTAIANGKYSCRLADGSMNMLEGRRGAEVYRNGTLPGREAAGFLRAGITRDLDRRTPQATVCGASRSWTAGGSKPGRTALQAAAGLQIRLSGNWNAVMNSSLESGKGRLDQSGRVVMVLEF